MKCKQKYKDKEKYRKMKQRQSAAYKARTGSGQFKGKWTDEAKWAVIKHEKSDRELSKEINHSVAAIQQMRGRIRRGEIYLEGYDVSLDGLYNDYANTSYLSTYISRWRTSSSEIEQSAAEVYSDALAEYYAASQNTRKYEPFIVATIDTYEMWAKLADNNDFHISSHNAKKLIEADAKEKDEFKLRLTTHIKPLAVRVTKVFRLNDGTPVGYAIERKWGKTC